MVQIKSIQEAKMALVHDYLIDNGGAERVVEIFQQMFPNAPLYTSVFNPATTLASFAATGNDIRTSFLQKLKPTKSRYKLLLPLYPYAFESFDMSNYDLVLSSSTSFAKGVITNENSCHFCFIHTPARFAWRYPNYIAQENLNLVKKIFLAAILPFMRNWDYLSAQRVDYFIANSNTTRKRVNKFYRREAYVIHSPIDVNLFEPSTTQEDYFLVVSRLAPYKRIDLAVQAAARLNKPLKIVGVGSDEARLKKMAGPRTEFLGRVPDNQLRILYSRCQALIFPGEEDFGLTPLECMASGRPVIAYQAGGALETVLDGKTGLFFTQQDDKAEDLAKVMRDFNLHGFQTSYLREWAEQFDKTHFERKLLAYLGTTYQQFQQGLASSIYQKER